MAEKDITEKILLSYADVFSDCINALAYGGKQYLNPQNTQPAPTESFLEILTGDTRFTELAKQFYENNQKGEKVMMCEYLNQLEERGERRGEINAETNLSSLLEKLYDLGRDEEAKLAVRNPDARAKMYKKFSIPNYRDKKSI